MRRALIALAAASLAMPAAAALAQDWGTFAMISSTLGVKANRLCIGEGLRVSDIGCPSYAPSVTTAGDVSVTGNLSANKFIGDGSGLTGITADATDRIISGTNARTRIVAVSNTGSISITQNNGETAWFDPVRGLVTLGVSATGGISGTTGYFSGRVGIGTATPDRDLVIVNGSDDGVVRIGSSYGAMISGDSGGRGIYGTNLYADGLSLRTAGTHGSYGYAGMSTRWGAVEFYTAAGATTADAAVTPTTRMRITSGGNVGIGTDNPAGTLHVSSSSWATAIVQAMQNDPVLQLASDTTAGNAGWRMGMDVSDDDLLDWRYNNSRKMLLTTSGKLRVGDATIPAGGTLEVAGTISATNAIQVGQSTLACASSISGAIRFNSTSNTLQVCTSAGWKSLVSGTVSGGGGGGGGGFGCALTAADVSTNLVVVPDGATATFYETGLVYQPDSCNAQSRSCSSGVLSGSFTYRDCSNPVCDVGATWAERTGPGSLSWKAIAASSGGDKLAAAVVGGYIYTSTDYGATWTQQTSSGYKNWAGLASSSDGTKLAATAYNSYIYTSTDSGATWTTRNSAGNKQWGGIASSADGTKLAAVIYGSYIHTSTDAGATWTQQAGAGSRNWVSIASSADGTKLAAIANGANVYTSTDSGATWTAQTGSGPRNWMSITSSADGMSLAAVASGNYIYTSADSGVTWTAQTGAGSRSWSSIASSADGMSLAAGVSTGYIYTSTETERGELSGEAGLPPPQESGVARRHSDICGGHGRCRAS